MSGPALLDVNLLIALFDPDHVHHDVAHDWFADHGQAGWATCSITENGFLRVLSNPKYGASASRPADLMRNLRQFCGSRGHVFWANSISLRDERLFNLDFVAGSRQLTDVYLLGLAHKMKGRLATFDRTIPVKAVRGAEAGTLHLVSPAAVE